MPTTIHVGDFGADPTATQDSAAAFQAAYARAALLGDGTIVDFGTGQYLSSKSFGDADGLGFSVVTQGAGRDACKVYATSGGQQQLLRMSNDGDVCIGITLDCATKSRAGSPLIVNGSHSHVQNLGALAADYFGVRFNRPIVAQKVGEMRSQPLLPDALQWFGQGNVLVDAVLYKDGARADDALLDIDFQQGFNGQGIVQTGSIMAIYICKDVSINGFSYTPVAGRTGQHGWSITAPSDTIALANFTSTGDGGRVGGGSGKWPHRRATNVVLVNHQMPATGNFMLGDVIGCQLSHCDFGGTVFLAPNYTLNNVTADHLTQVGAIRYAPASGAEVSDVHLPGFDRPGAFIVPDAPGWQGPLPGSGPPPSSGGGGSGLLWLGAAGVAAAGVVALSRRGGGYHAPTNRRQQAGPRRFISTTPRTSYTPPRGSVLPPLRRTY